MQNIRFEILSVWVIALGLSQPAGAAGTSYIGGSGLLSTPTAETMPEGEATAGINRHNPNRGRVGDTEIYSLSFGLWPELEVAGRLANSLDYPQGGVRDLSFDAKVQVFHFTDGPRFAIGVQDFGGQAPLLRSKYAVATWPWRSLSASIGYGSGPDALVGVFGGVEWSPWSYLSLLADHDGADTHAGLRLSTGDWLGRVRATLTTSYNDTTREIEGGVALRFPLGVNDSAPSKQAAAQPAQSLAPVPPAIQRPAPETGLAAGILRTAPSLEGLSQSLAKQGFEMVSVGARPDGTVVVLVENRVYNHSFVDAVGAALAVVSGHLPEFEGEVELTLTRYGVPQVTATTPLAGYRALRAGAGPETLRRQWRIRYADSIADADEIRWQGTVAPMRAVELILEPFLRTFVGTEYGPMDYALGLRARTVVPLARGVLFTGGIRAPVVMTDDFKSGRNFAGSAPSGGVDHALLQFFHKPNAQWAWLWSVGLTRVAQADLAVAALEQLWMSETGAHQWRAKLMAFDAAASTRRVALGGYTWFDAPRRYSLSLTGGRFYTGEGGGKVEVNRYFGDMIVGFFWRAASRDDQVAGIQVSVPLTPRRDQNPENVQVKGSPRWGHGLGTTVNAFDGRNPLRPSLLFEPTLDLDLRRDFFDSGRLTPEYLDSNTERLLEAGELVETRD